jgi:hypothetical protein
MRTCMAANKQHKGDNLPLIQSAAKATISSWNGWSGTLE